MSQADRVTLALAQARQILPETRLILAAADRQTEFKALYAWIEATPSDFKGMARNAAATQLHAAFLSNEHSSPEFWALVLGALEKPTLAAAEPEAIIVPVAVAETTALEPEWRADHLALRNRLRDYKQRTDKTWQGVWEDLGKVGAQIDYNQVISAVNITNIMGKYRPISHKVYSDMCAALDLIDESAKPAPVVVAVAPAPAPANVQLPPRGNAMPGTRRERLDHIERALDEKPQVSINALAKELGLKVGAVNELVHAVPGGARHIGNGVYTRRK